MLIPLIFTLHRKESGEGALNERLCLLKVCKKRKFLSGSIPRSNFSQSDMRVTTLLSCAELLRFLSDQHSFKNALYVFYTVVPKLDCCICYLSFSVFSITLAPCTDILVTALTSVY